MLYINALPLYHKWQVSSVRFTRVELICLTPFPSSSDKEVFEETTHSFIKVSERTIVRSDNTRDERNARKRAFAVRAAGGSPSFEHVLCCYTATYAYTNRHIL